MTEDGIPLYGDVFGERDIDEDDEQVRPIPPTPPPSRAAERSRSPFLMWSA